VELVCIQRYLAGPASSDAVALGVLPLQM
jgi:hypothetical protein